MTKDEILHELRNILFHARTEADKAISARDGGNITPEDADCLDAEASAYIDCEELIEVLIARIEGGQ
jgi:hypothetical protein